MSKRLLAAGAVMVSVLGAVAVLPPPAQAAETGPDRMGVVRAEDGHWRWLIRTSAGGGPAQRDFVYGLDRDVPVWGDWNNDGVKTPGVFRNGQWHLKNFFEGGEADVTITYGRGFDMPVVGDWDGNGTTGIGVVRGNRWLLKNTISSGNHDIQFDYGVAGTDRPIVGDWFDQGADRPGVWRDGRWLLKRTLSGGDADLTFDYGRATDTPVVGDWDGAGADGIGVFRGNQWFLKQIPGGGNADTTIAYGRAGDRPIHTFGPLPPPTPPPPAILWGVDSLDTITPAFLDSITAAYGKPDVFARYVNVMTAGEVSVAHGRDIRLLLIKQAGTSNTVGYALGQSTADEAVAEARALGAPGGVALFINLEAENAIDTPYIQGWYDRVVAHGFYPGYYGHTGTSTFNNAYCGAVAANGAIGNSIIWTPSPNPGRTTKAAMPPFAPNPPPCAARTDAWQYGLIGDGPPPNIDTNEFRSTIPLW